MFFAFISVLARQYPRAAGAPIPAVHAGSWDDTTARCAVTAGLKRLKAHRQLEMWKKAVCARHPARAIPQKKQIALFLHFWRHKKPQNSASGHLCPSHSTILAVHGHHCAFQYYPDFARFVTWRQVHRISPCGFASTNLVIC